MLFLANDPATGQLLDLSSPTSSGLSTSASREFELVPATPSVTGTQLVWVYTNWLNDIASSRCLQASSVRSMPDQAEFGYGVGGLVQTFQNLDRAPYSAADIDWVAHALLLLRSMLDAPTFALCGSLHGDSLPLWREYARDNGVAVGLPNGAQLLVLRTSSESQAPSGFATSWRQVLYGREEQKQLCLETLHYMFRHVGDQERCACAVMHCVGFMKHPAYQVEQEVRSLFHWYNAAADADFISTRPATGVSYIELVGAPGEPDPSRRFATARLLPRIRAVALAPPRQQDSLNRTQESVRALLGEVQVVRSNIPAWI